ncbi:Hypothetical_protein [Hexamita inflata]|uniref:Hypothetical_protein n=1 Tax=Hexamita inflata TaxID=28002 RepID=A0AA86TVY6_9EUKA|nr:Hypothetical protein HINF_LOCUS18449 [Hexamita inflata]
MNQSECTLCSRSPICVKFYLHIYESFQSNQLEILLLRSIHSFDKLGSETLNIIKYCYIVISDLNCHSLQSDEYRHITTSVQELQVHVNDHQFQTHLCTLGAPPQPRQPTTRVQAFRGVTWLLRASISSIYTGIHLRRTICVSKEAMERLPLSNPEGSLMACPQSYRSLMMPAQHFEPGDFTFRNRFGCAASQVGRQREEQPYEPIIDHTKQSWYINIILIFRVYHINIKQIIEIEHKIYYQQFRIQQYKLSSC